MINYLLDPFIQIENKNGLPVIGAKIYVYYTGSRTVAPIYSDKEGTSLVNPAITDTLGNVTIFAQTGSFYDVLVYDNDDTLLFSKINVTPSDSTSADVKEVDIEAGFGIQVHKRYQENKAIYNVSIDPDEAATSEEVANIQNQLDNKKDKQLSKSYSGSKTKTITNLSQDANGVITVNYEDIDLPSEVPNVEITSKDNSVQVTETTDVQTNTKKFDLSVNIDDPLEYGQFRATNVTSQAQLAKINGNIELNNYAIKLKKGNSYHFTVRGSYVANNTVNTNSTIVYIEPISFNNIQVNVDNTITDSQFFEISYDVYKLSSDKNYNVAFSSIADGKVSELWVEVHNLNGVSVNGGSGGGGTTYSAGYGIVLNDNTISLNTDIFRSGNCIGISRNDNNMTFAFDVTAGITDIKLVESLPTEPISTVLYLIPE